MDKFTNHPLFVGILGEAGIEATNVVTSPVIEAGIQLLIAVVTLWKLLKKPRKTEAKNESDTPKV